MSVVHPKHRARYISHKRSETVCMFPADCSPPAERWRLNTYRTKGLLCITKFVPGLLRLITSLLTNVSTQPTIYQLCQGDRWCYLMYASELPVNLLHCCPSHDPAAVWHHHQRWKPVYWSPRSPDKRTGTHPQSLTLKRIKDDKVEPDISIF